MNPFYVNGMVFHFSFFFYEKVDINRTLFILSLISLKYLLILNGWKMYSGKYSTPVLKLFIWKGIHFWSFPEKNMMYVVSVLLTWLLSFIHSREPIHKNFHLPFILLTTLEPFILCKVLSNFRIKMFLVPRNSGFRNGIYKGILESIKVLTRLFACI